ncbi:MAG: hypothetical protein OIF58_15940, partial [Cohaesibacter sp.]|nr:hypothetical protein [Cohaesibacter sp.]
ELQNICSPQFWASDEHEVTRGLSPAGVKIKPTRRKKKKAIFKEVLIHSHSQQIFSAEPFSADLLSAAILSRSSQHSQSQQIFSAQPFSADLLSYHVAVVRGWWSAIVSSDCCGQGLVVSCCLIICCGQGLVVSYCVIICCGQGLVVSYCLIMVVSYCLIMLMVNFARVLYKDPFAELSGTA